MLLEAATHPRVSFHGPKKPISRVSSLVYLLHALKPQVLLRISLPARGASSVRARVGDTGVISKVELPALLISFNRWPRVVPLMRDPKTGSGAFADMAHHFNRVPNPPAPPTRRRRGWPPRLRRRHHPDATACGQWLHGHARLAVPQVI
jgi:hypothetical protein